MTYERLTAADAAFLHLETPHEPQHVGSLSVIEGSPLRDETGRIRFDDVKRQIGTRLGRVPRLRQKLMNVPLAQGHPIWVDDADFDIDYHVRLTSLPRPGDEMQLATLMGRLQAQPLDRRRPLWELWMVDGLEGDDVAMIVKSHHAMGDGIASVDMTLALVDLEPEPAPTGESADWQPRPAPSANRLLVDSVWEQVSRPITVARAAMEAARDPRPMLRSVSNVMKAITELRITPDPLPWNVPVSPHRRWSHADLSIDAVRTVKRGRDMTINDVVLATCTGALRKFLIGHGVDVEHRVLRAMVPISTRADDQHGELGNRVSMLLVELPVNEPDPMERLRKVHAECAQAKRSGFGDGAELMVRLADGVPMLAPAITRLASRRMPMNLVITNIPGPPLPLYLCGARVLRTYPYVEVLDDEGLTIAVVSYEGRLFFGLTADRDVIADLDLLAEAIEKEFLALSDAVVH